MKLRKLILEIAEPTEENVGHNTPPLLERSLLFLSILTDTLAQTLLGSTRYKLMLAITPKQKCCRHVWSSEAKIQASIKTGRRSGRSVLSMQRAFEIELERTREINNSPRSNKI